MQALGGVLIADDHLQLRRSEGGLWARAHPAIAGLVEIRGMGIMRAPITAPVRVALVVDLNKAEAERLPPLRRTQVMGVDLPLQYRIAGDGFAAAILHYLAWGRSH